MKKQLMQFVAVALMGAPCVFFVACGGNGGGPEPKPEDPIVLTDPSKYDGYYMSGEQKIELTKMDDLSYIVFKSSDTQAVTEKLAALGGEVEQVSPLHLNGVENPEEHLLNCSWAVVSTDYNDVVTITEMIYSVPIYITSDGHEMGIPCDFFVTLKDENDRQKLEKLAEDNNVLFLGKDDEGQYGLACTKESTGNALQIVNWLFEMDWIERIYQSTLERPTTNKNTIS